MNEHTWEEIESQEDQCERLVYELSEELREYDEDSEPWNLCHQELCDAENELVYWQRCKEDYE